MKRPVFIGLLLLLALAACHQPKAPEVHQGAEGPPPLPTPFPELVAVDSLTWELPDSAFVLLLPYFDTCRDAMLAPPTDDADTLLEEMHSMCLYNRHYAHLLLSELLYKNGYAQTNREELQQAADYYDSLTAGTGWADTRGVSQQDIFLAARAHYINGVGCYERDCIMQACQEYILALEIMEEYFDEKELVGKKARFMALAYTHLASLFSDQYLHEQAIYLGKEALVYYEKYDATPWHLSWMLCEIGSQYEMKGDLDSAICYYQKGEKILPDTNNLSFRDLASRLAFLSYVQGEGSVCSLRRLKSLLSQAESEKEYFARCLTIGRILFRENDFDSAWIYLNKIYHNASGVESKRQAAEWLVEICNVQGRTEDIHEYAHFLVPFANLNENQSHLKSQLTKTIHDYEREKLEIAHRKQLRKLGKFGGAALVALAIIALVFIVFHFVNKKRYKHLKKQNEEKERQLESERHAHKMKQAALAGRLKQRNEELRAHKEERENMRKTLEKHQRRSDWSSLGVFLEEDICKEIMNALHNKDIKREAKVGDHTEMKLSATQLSRLDVAVEKHFRGFTKMLTDMYPRISNDEIHQCQLYLLDVEDVQIAHLLFCDYSTVKKRSRKLKTAFKIEKELRLFIKGFVL